MCIMIRVGVFYCTLLFGLATLYLLYSSLSLSLSSFISYSFLVALVS